MADWPRYKVGSEDSIFALGVISVNFAQLEFAVFGIFSTIMGLEREASSRLMYKLTNETRTRLMTEVLSIRKWPAPAPELTQHFIDSHKICYENRNKLAHSNMLSLSPDSIVLAKVGRDGKATLANPSLSELRQVADDIKTYFEFGLWLSNMINAEIIGPNSGLDLLRAGDRAYSTWPDKPPLPIPLEYTSDPRPIRPLR